MQTLESNVDNAHRLIWKTIAMSIVVVGTNVVGNYGLGRGLRDVGVIESWSPVPYILAFAHPWVVAGVMFMLAWLITRLILLSWADLTYVLPVTSFSYVLSAFAGAVLLRERVSLIEWIGIWLITGGVGLVVFTYPETTPAPESSE
jgi:drug/metabolite transporter (DMT)-like permease